MKAVVLRKFGEAASAFKIEELATPDPAPGQVLIEVEAFGLNFADITARKGMYAPVKKLPFILGYDVVGRIVKCGKGVNGNILHQRVIALTRFGGYAQYAVTDALAVAVIGDMAADRALPLATQYTTAWYAMEELLRLLPGEAVLIHAAAGGVGIALTQIARWRGLKVIATTGSDEKCEFLKSKGIENVINYRRQNYPKVVNDILQGTKLRASFNSIAGATMRQDMALLQVGGAVVVFGASSRSNAKPAWWANLKVILNTGFISPIQLILQSKSLLGINMLKLGSEKPDLVTACMRRVVELSRRGELQPESYISLPVEEIGRAHELIETRQTKGKVVIRWPEHASPD